MPYQIILSNGSVLTNLADNTVDNTTSLTLVGRNYPGYGQIIADDLVHLLENAANTSAPGNPLVGQLWFNTTTSLMNVWTGSTWFALTTGVSSVLGFSGAITLSQMVTGGLAPLASPALTGIPTAPTATSGTSTTQLATTAFVVNQVGAIVGGVSSVLGFRGAITLAQMVSGGLAPLGSPSLVGVPTAPTPATGTNNTQIATTAFVINEVGSLSTGVSSVLGNTGAVTLIELVNGGVAPTASPALQGVPTAPTAAYGTNTGQLATTGFVNALLTSTNTWSGQNKYTSNIVLNNQAWMYSLDSGGIPRLLFGMDASNSTRIWCGADGLNITNEANTANIIVFDNGGNMTLAGSVNATGNVVAGNGRLRAGFGAYQSGDSQAAVILNDFLHWSAQASLPQAGLSGTGGYQIFPNGLIIQWQAFGLVAQTSNFAISFPLAFPNACTCVVGCVGNSVGATAVNYGLGVSPTAASYFTATLQANFPVGGTAGCCVMSVGW